MYYILCLFSTSHIRCNYYVCHLDASNFSSYWKLPKILINCRAVTTNTMNFHFLLCVTSLQGPFQNYSRHRLTHRTFSYGWFQINVPRNPTVSWRVTRVPADSMWLIRIQLYFRIFAKLWGVHSRIGSCVADQKLSK